MKEQIKTTPIEKVRKLWEIHNPDGSLKKQIFAAVEGNFFYDDDYEIDWTKDKLQRYKDNYDNNVYGQKIPINVEHNSNNPEGAAGWWAGAELREIEWRDGTKRLALLVTPEWTDYGKKLVENRRFLYLSPEFYDEWMDKETREIHRDVIKALALVTCPHIKNQPELTLKERDSMTTKTLGELSAVIAMDDKREELWKVWNLCQDLVRKKLIDPALDQFQKQQEIKGITDELAKLLYQYTALPPDMGMILTEMQADDEDMSIEDMMGKMKMMGDRMKEKMKGKKGSPKLKYEMEGFNKLMDDLYEAHFKPQENKESEGKSMSEKTEVKASEVKLVSPEEFRALEERHAKELAEMKKRDEARESELKALREHNRAMKVKAYMDELVPYYVKAGEQETVRKHLMTLGERSEVMKLRESDQVIDPIVEYVDIVKRCFQPIEIKTHQIGSGVVASEPGAKPKSLSEKIKAYAEEKGLSYYKASEEMHAKKLITGEDKMD